MMTYAEGAAETNGPIFEPGCLRSPVGETDAFRPRRKVSLAARLRLGGSD
jgi:hypothetical protein